MHTEPTNTPRVNSTASLCYLILLRTVVPTADEGRSKAGGGA